MLIKKRYLKCIPNPGSVNQCRAALALAGPANQSAAAISRAIAVGTFALFLPHSLLWGIRELFITTDKEKMPRGHDSQKTD